MLQTCEVWPAQTGRRSLLLELRSQKGNPPKTHSFLFRRKIRNAREFTTMVPPFIPFSQISDFYKTDPNDLHFF